MQEINSKLDECPHCGKHVDVWLPVEPLFTIGEVAGVLGKKVEWVYNRLRNRSEIPRLYRKRGKSHQLIRVLQPWVVRWLTLQSFPPAIRKMIIAELEGVAH